MRRSGSRVSIHKRVRRNRCFGHRVSRLTICPLGQPEKAIGLRVSDRTMVGTAQPLCLSASGTEGRRHRGTMNLRKGQRHNASFRYLGWTARPFPPRLPVAGEVFLLTSPFIERANRTSVPWLPRSPVRGNVVPPECRNCPDLLEPRFWIASG